MQLENSMKNHIVDVQNFIILMIIDDCEEVATVPASKSDLFQGHTLLIIYAYNKYLTRIHKFFIFHRNEMRGD